MIQAESAERATAPWREGTTYGPRRDRWEHNPPDAADRVDFTGVAVRAQFRRAKEDGSPKTGTDGGVLLTLDTRVDGGTAPLGSSLAIIEAGPGVLELQWEITDEDGDEDFPASGFVGTDFKLVFPGGTEWPLHRVILPREATFTQDGDT